MKTMTATEHSSIPRFKFQLPNRHFHCGLITVDIEVVHRIVDVDNFYNSLGYTDEIRETGLTFDEFMWFEYRKDNCNKSESCLQAKIIEYLIKYSSSFVEKYGDQYENWLGICFNEMKLNSAECTNCIMHPNQRNNEYFNCSAKADNIPEPY